MTTGGRQIGIQPGTDEKSMWRDLAELFECLTINLNVATILGSIPASFDTVKSWGDRWSRVEYIVHQIKPRWLYSITKKKVCPTLYCACNVLCNINTVPCSTLDSMAFPLCCRTWNLFDQSRLHTSTISYTQSETRINRNLIQLPKRDVEANSVTGQVWIHEETQLCKKHKYTAR